MKSSLSLVLLVAWLGAASPLFAEEFLVIVNASVPGTSIERRSVANIYLKQVVQWPNGAAIEPWDQSVRSPVRARFTEVVFGQAIPWVTNYWSRRMTAGMGWPPQVKASDAEMIAQVRKARGAIGYVSAEAALDETVKALKLID